MLHIHLLGGVTVHVDGRPATGAAAQPRRLALLAVVACAGAAGIRRERLTSLFWPDADDEHARAALKQALYALRRDLGESVIGGQQVLQLDPGAATSDVTEFRAALAAGRLERATELYAGPLLDGFRLPNAESFERWLDDERRTLAREYVETLDRLATDASRRGDATAVRWWRTLAAQEPLSVRAAIGLMEALAAAGDVGAALRHARVHAALLAQELELPPDPQVAVVEARLRAGMGAGRRTPDAGVPSQAAVAGVALPPQVQDSTPVEPTVGVTVAPRKRWRTRWRAPTAAALALVVAVVAAVAAWSTTNGATRSVVAHRLYSEALERAFRDGDWIGARQLFAASVREDSTFAMAAWWHAYVADAAPEERTRLLARANRLAAHASERERLQINANVALATSSPALRAYAESLVTRYPDEVEGHRSLGTALRLADDYAAALPHLERVVAMEVARPRDHACLACRATIEIVGIYLAMDSLDAAERTVRRWIERDPRSASAWQHLALVLEGEGGEHLERALDAWRTFAALDPPTVSAEQEYLVQHWLRARRYARADALLQSLLQTGGGSVDEVGTALWWRAISLRQQGRVAEALRDAHRLRSVGTIADPGPGAAPSQAVLEAQLLLDAGQSRAAAALFDSIGRLRRVPDVASEYARNRTWMLAHAANALAAAGDTAALARLVDTVAFWGRQSLLGRDQRLHHHVRGLLLAARGDDEAAVAEFEAAARSWSLGYSRTNLALARSLLKLRRPLEAVRVLQPAFRGPLEGVNLYVSRTELHALLGRAWADAGNADSAAAHRRIVAEDWAHADADYVRRMVAELR